MFAARFNYYVISIPTITFTGIPTYFNPTLDYYLDIHACDQDVDFKNVLIYFNRGNYTKKEEKKALEEKRSKRYGRRRLIKTANNCILLSTPNVFQSDN